MRSTKVHKFMSLTDGGWRLKVSYRHSRLVSCDILLTLTVSSIGVIDSYQC